MRLCCSLITDLCPIDAVMLTAYQLLRKHNILPFDYYHSPFRCTRKLLSVFLYLTAIFILCSRYAVTLLRNAFPLLQLAAISTRHASTDTNSI